MSYFRFREILDLGSQVESGKGCTSGTQYECVHQDKKPCKVGEGTETRERVRQGRLTLPEGVEGSGDEESGEWVPKSTKKETQKYCEVK